MITTANLTEETKKRINLIFERQTETEMDQLLYEYCKEEGHDTGTIDQAIENERDAAIVGHWGEARYNRNSILNMLIFITNN